MQLNNSSLLLQLSCIRTSTHYLGKRTTINFANDISGLDVDYHNNDRIIKSQIKCQRIMIS